VTEAQAQLDTRMMLRALRAGASGSPSPSPRAGAVVVRAGKLVSVGFHARSAAPNAEVVALRRAGKAARGATLYVTLAPTATDVIIAAGVRRVVVGCPNPAGRGSSQRLRKHGIDVVMGVERTRAERLIADFAKVTRLGLPRVTLKSAVTLDGRTAARSGESKWITGPQARREVHRMRARCDAVLVGIGTVLADDPELTVREVRGRNPLRVVLDSELRTSLRSKLVRGAREIRTLIFHARDASPRRALQLKAAGVELVVIARGRQGLDPTAALRELARRDVLSVLVEGGAHVHAALLEAGLVDHAAVFVAARILGDAQALPLAAGQSPRRLDQAFVLDAPEVVRLGDDVLVRGDLKSATVPAAQPHGPAARSRSGPRRGTTL
jgi:diaminohydroxyphosphoribosylaminopyrimidine deaminase/5-amino-6-(5-phosphoribosylamino)uracil reductase